VKRKNSLQHSAVYWHSIGTGSYRNLKRKVGKPAPLHDFLKTDFAHFTVILYDVWTAQP
jgi:hypothetical protein